MIEPKDDRPIDAESEEMIELEELVRAKDAKRKEQSDEEDSSATPTP